MVKKLPILSLFLLVFVLGCPTSDPAPDRSLPNGGNGNAVDPGCLADGECDDGNLCNGNETCVAGACQPGTPVVCLDDGMYCNGTEACNPADGQCESGPTPCSEDCCEDADTCIPADGCCDDSECDDNNTCTADACVSDSCQHTPECVANADCDDVDVATLDVCAGGCCTNTEPAVDYPFGFIESAEVCPFICLTLNADDTVCDSDCDGWDDSVDDARCDSAIPGTFGEILYVCEDVLVGPLAPTDVLFAYCWPGVLSETGISQTIAQVEAGRLSGRSFNEAAEVNLATCATVTDFGTFPICLDCFAAITMQVYGLEVPLPESVPPPPPLPPLPIVTVMTILVANDGQFLGYVNDNPFDPDSLASRYGTYGNRYSAVSIWYRYGDYGSRYSDLSPWDEYTRTPPIMFEDGVFVAYVTANDRLSPAIHPNELAIAVGRTDVLR